MVTIDSTKMEYRYLGKTGLKVSVLSFGNWVNNDNDQLTKDSVKICLENGVNFFDTAEYYEFGKAETSLGKAFKALKVPREKIVVTTKILRVGYDPNDGFQSRKHIIEGLRNSLKRLQLDYVDIVYAHRYDMYTPLEETCRAYDWVIKNGYAFYWGTSEWTASQIMEAYKICDKLNLIKPVVEECQYNMLVRDKMENEYRDLFKKYKMGTSVWSPLFSGVLTGKYINEIPGDSRFGSKTGKALYAKPLYLNKKEEWDKKLIQLKEIAEKKLGCSLGQLALAWVIINPDISTCILGASKTEQLIENFKAIEISKKITKEMLLDIEKILQNSPEGEMDFRDWKQLPSRRNHILDVNYVPNN